MTAASSIVATVLPGTVPGDLGEVLANVTRVTLVSAVLGGTVLACVGLIEATLLRRAAAAVRHRVWAMTLANLLVVPFLPLVAPPWRVPIIPPTVIEVAGSAVWPEGKPGEPALRPAGNSRSASNAGTANSSPQLATEDRAPSMIGVSRSIAWARRLSYESVVLLIWLWGVALLLIRIFVGGLRTSVLLRHARLVTNTDCRALVEELRLQLGLRREVRLLEYPDAIVPMMLGVLRPVILLPQSAQGWSEQARRAVLLHELCTSSGATSPFSCWVEWPVRLTGSSRWRGGGFTGCEWNGNMPAMTWFCRPVNGPRITQSSYSKWPGCAVGRTAWRWPSRSPGEQVWNNEFASSSTLPAATYRSAIAGLWRSWC